MKLRHGLIAALLMAAFSFIAGPTFAAGMFQGTPAATTVPPYGCIPADVYGPSYTGNNQGLIPQTVCMTPGQLGNQVVGNALSVYSTIPIGSVAYASLGTNTTDVAGQLWITSFRLPVDMTITNIACLQGGTAGTDKVIYALYNSSGTLLANTATAGTALNGSASTFLSAALTSTYAAKSGLYYIALQGNGTAAGAIATVAASTYLGVAATSASGTFGTLPAITVPTTFTANKAPICYVN